MLRGRLMRLSMSSPFRRLVVRLPARRIARVQPPPRISRSPKARRPHAPPPLARTYRGWRTDAFIISATLMALVIVASGYLNREPAYEPEFATIFVSPRYWEIFGDTAEAFVREFEAQNPGVRVVSSDGYGLDVVFFDDGEFACLLGISALASLAPYIYTERGEEQWALPLVSFVDLFFYNIDILQMAGNDRPPQTRAEFLEAARSVAQTPAAARGEVFPFALGLCESDAIGIRRDFYPWVWSVGADAHAGFADDGTLAITSQAANAIGFFADMQREGLIAPGTFETTGRARLEQFAEGRIAMLAGSARDILFVRNVPGDVSFDVTAIPSAAPGRNRIGMSGIYAGISSASAYPDKAWSFLVFIAGRSHLLSAALGAVPGSMFLHFPGRHIEEDPLSSKAWDIFEAADIVEFQSGDLLEREASRAIRERLFQAFAEAQ